MVAQAKKAEARDNAAAAEAELLASEARVEAAKQAHADAQLAHQVPHTPPLLPVIYTTLHV